MESPVPRDEVVRRIREAAGLGRAGDRIRAAIGGAIAHLRRQERVKVRGEFLWEPSMARPPTRSRDSLPASLRKIELIAPEEIEEAVQEVVRSAFGIEKEDLVGEVLRFFGFQRTSPDLGGVVETVVESMIAEGVLVEDRSVIRVGIPA